MHFFPVFGPPPKTLKPPAPNLPSPKTLKLHTHKSSGEGDHVALPYLCCLCEHTAKHFSFFATNKVQVTGGKLSRNLTKPCSHTRLHNLSYLCEPAGLEVRYRCLSFLIFLLFSRVQAQKGYQLRTDCNTPNLEAFCCITARQGQHADNRVSRRVHRLG